MSTVRTMAPVVSSVRWLILSILAWQVVQAVRATGPTATGAWPINPYELLLLFVMPPLTAFAFVRLFLASVQAAYGSLNTYTLTASPWAWVFWLGLALGMVGQGAHLTADALNAALPGVVANGEFAAKVEFFDEDLGHWLLGLGFFLITAVVVVLGQGTSGRVMGGERLLLMLGSLLTYGFTVVYLGVEGGQMAATIIASAVITGLGLWVLPPGEVTRDPVGLLVVPGTSLGGFVLLTWGLVVGGQPSWPW
jgi:hypothetical protein